MKSKNSTLVAGSARKLGGMKTISAAECQAVSGGILIISPPPRTPPVDGVSRPSPK